MRDIPKIILFAIGLPQVILSSGCPLPADLGPRTDDNKSMCAVMYADATTDPHTSCSGDYLQLKNGETATSIASGWNDRVSSLVVRAGCTLTAYGDGDLKGYRQDFHGMHFYLGHEHDIARKYEPFFNWNDVISSYICQCWFKPVDCVPGDNWKQIISCDNSANSTMSCKYTQTHGITIGKGYSNGHTTSECIKAKVAAEIGIQFGIAEASGSASLTTSFRWTQSEEFNISEKETEETGDEVEIDVPAGSHIGVYQIQGVCGNSTTKTNCFQSRDEHTKMVLSTTCPDRKSVV